jgi:hypothetical protein
MFVEPRFDPAASATLVNMWLLLFGVPEVLCRSHLMLEATKILGWPRMVDEASLAGLGSARMLFHSPNPVGIPDVVMLFANL